METKVKDGKTYANISDLTGWDKNPRKIDSKDLERLKKQIIELKQYKPLLVNKDGTVLGGNMRLKALNELNQTEVWVSVVEAETEEEKLKYALSDNDQAGRYDKDELVDLINELDIDTELFKVDLGKPIDLGDLLADNIELDVSGGAEIDSEVDSMEFTQPTSNIRMFQLFLDDETHPIFTQRIAEIQKVLNTANPTDTVFEAIRHAYDQIVKN